MTAIEYSLAINQHYGRHDLGAAILDALRVANKNPDQLTYDDLALVDQFHTRGREATLELAQLADVQHDLRVLDVGGGLGGAARTLAAEFGCRVTVLDLTEEYCRVGAMLTTRTALSDRVSFKIGNALALPFPDRSFDLVWTQHSSMNIENKERLYAEIHRVLRMGGRLALHEIMAGALQPVQFPVPWAPHSAISFLRSVVAMQTVIQAAGFHELVWIDVSRPSLEWFRHRAAAAAAPPLGLHLLLGEMFGPAFRNQIQNLEEGRIAVIEAVFERIE